MLAGLLWTGFVASLALTATGRLRRSWLNLALAASLSLVFGVAALFNVGAMTVMLTCVQLAGAVVLRWGVDWRGALAWSLLGGFVWVVAIFGQLAVGIETPQIVVLPLALIAGLSALVIGGVARRLPGGSNLSE